MQRTPLRRNYLNIFVEEAAHAGRLEKCRNERLPVASNEKQRGGRGSLPEGPAEPAGTSKLI